MKVKELIEKLQKYDSEQMVVIYGYEGGYDEVDKINEIKLKLNVNKAWYYGKHEIVDDNEDFDCVAVYIG
jgi:hypothetical protein